MRRFGTHGRVYPEDHYVVPRTTEVADFINRVKAGRYIVLFAPRQTGKTTFFQLALEALEAKGTDGMCEILNPIYQQRIMQAFKPLINGLEQEYFPEDTCLKLG